eukprot:2685401-Rhodomonas_salina.1
MIPYSQPRQRRAANSGDEHSVSTGHGAVRCAPNQFQEAAIDTVCPERGALCLISPRTCCWCFAASRSIWVVAST